MKQQEIEEEKQTNRRKTLDSFCSRSGLLLSVVCCIALIHVELRIQEHHRLISHSATLCEEMETEILGKVQQNSGRGQVLKGSHSEGHRQKTRSKGSCVLIFVLLHANELRMSILSAAYVFQDVLHSGINFFRKWVSSTAQNTTE